MKLVSLENLAKYNELLNQKIVKSVNSALPDSNGNVSLEIPQAVGVTRFPDYEHPVTIFDVVNKGTNEDVNFDHTFTEDGYFHYRLLAGNNYNHDAIFQATITINESVFNIDERTILPSSSIVESDAAAVSDLIPVPKGAVLHIGTIKCSVQPTNAIEFFPLKNAGIIGPGTGSSDTSDCVKDISFEDGVLSVKTDTETKNITLFEVQEDDSTDSDSSSSSSGTVSSSTSTDSLKEIEIDISQRYHKILLNTSETLLRFSEYTSENSNSVLKLDLFIEQGTGTNTLTWPENIKWENGLKPVLAQDQGNTDYISLISLDSGSTFFGYSKAVWMK